MRLASFRVQNYKTIDDTGEIPVDEHVTALVGKNESGKTAILKAIWKTKNVAGIKFDKLLDYPRTSFSQERKGTQPVVTLTFNLTEFDIAEIKKVLPGPTPDVKQAIFTSFYKGEEDTSSIVAFPNLVEQALQRDAGEAREIVERVRLALISDATIADASKVAWERLPATGRLWDQPIPIILSDFFNVVSQWRNQQEERKTYATAEIEALSKVMEVSKAGEPLASARKWVLENLPTFIYFDDYGQLETRIHLPVYLQRKNTPDPKVRTQTALFEKANLDPQEILELGRPRQNNEAEDLVQRRKDKRGVLLESASFSLTGEWTEWWTEKRHQLSFMADGDDLVLRVSDEHNPAKIPFEERSQGFQWFFSFYLVFMIESARAHKNAILLLDEPGLHLHPGLQERLIGYFNRVSEDNQLIYSTHLPFLVDANHLERVRTVHLNDGDPKKTKVSNNVRPEGDRDTLFPLQAAVGYSIAQTLFLGKRSVIIEGITDYWILKSLNDTMIGAGEKDILHPDTVLIPAGGISKLMPLASIMFANSGPDGKNMLVVLDSDKEGRAGMGRVNEAFGSDSRVMLLGTAIGMSDATIEDMLPRDVYRKAVEGALGKTFSFTPDELTLTLNVAAVQKAFQREGFGKFEKEEKAIVALKIITDWGKNPKAIPPETIEMARKLFVAINARFL